jgi:hypothetical protein
LSFRLSPAVDAIQAAIAQAIAIAIAKLHPLSAEALQSV